MVDYYIIYVIMYVYYDKYKKVNNSTICNGIVDGLFCKEPGTKLR